MHKNKEAEIKVSVIIPVWNTGPGISRCIESLRNQTLKEIEMIFVDDCGSDDSMDSVRVAAAEDSRIRIITNEENIGSGASRNRGIEAALGEYLSFVDPDDYVDTSFLDLLYKAASRQSFDIVKGSMIRENKHVMDTDTNRGLNQIIANGLSVGKALYTLFTYEHTTALYRREFILANNIRFGTSSRAQDTTFLLQACSQTENFSIVNEACYYYCECEDSAMNTIGTQKIQGFLQSIIERQAYILNYLSRDNDSLYYIKNMFLMALREYVRYVSIPKMSSDAEAYLSELRKILIGLSCCEDVIRESLSLRILYEWGVGLPLTPYYSPWEGNNPPVRYAKLVQRWIDFYLDASEERKEGWKDLKQLIVKANNAANGKPHSSYSSAEQIQGKTILNCQIKRLPLNLRLQIELSMAKSRIKQSIIGKLRK